MRKYLIVSIFVLVAACDQPPPTPQQSAKHSAALQEWKDNCTEEKLKTCLGAFVVWSNSRITHIVTGPSRRVGADLHDEYATSNGYMKDMVDQDTSYGYIEKIVRPGEADWYDTAVAFSRQFLYKPGM